jgi:hypothetical protein
MDLPAAGRYTSKDTSYQAGWTGESHSHPVVGKMSLTDGINSTGKRKQERKAWDNVRSLDKGKT